MGTVGDGVEHDGGRVVTRFVRVDGDVVVGGDGVCRCCRGATVCCCPEANGVWCGDDVAWAVGFGAAEVGDGRVGFAVEVDDRNWVSWWGKVRRIAVIVDHADGSGGDADGGDLIGHDGGKTIRHDGAVGVTGDVDAAAVDVVAA